MPTERHKQIRALFDDYIALYAARDDRLTSRFSENFSGYTGGGDFLVKDRDEWIKITRQDFAQVNGQLRIEMLDLSLQDLCAEVVVVTAFFHIHLPIPESILSRESARLVLVFRQEGTDWKIVHSGISIPYYLVRAGEVYPIDGLHERHRELEALVDQRTKALQAANDKLEALSNTDGLTGIANRRSFDTGLAQEWKRAQRTGTSLALLVIDVDRFKHFNDHYGHLAGDDCLRALGKVLGETGRRAEDLVARYGGEEFVVMLPGAKLPDVLERARHIQQAIRSLAIAHAGTPAAIVTVSIGVAVQIPSPQQPADDLVQRADQALYQAKRNGRNRVCAAPGCA
ncbi:MAG: diguanylate cyclase protein [Proteobacteria bacterium]|nr:diguanylate cyclase protein [Pseudomonadota bacterium]